MGFISLTDAKKHLRVDSDDEDGYITLLIASGAQHISNLTGHTCPAVEDYEFVFDHFPRQIMLPLRPVDPQTIAMSYLDTDGIAQSFTEFRTFEMNGTTRIVPTVGALWPVPASAPGAVTLAATIGYATDENGAIGCPESLKHALRLLIGHWFRNRETVALGTISTNLPHAVDALLHPERLHQV